MPLSSSSGRALLLLMLAAPVLSACGESETTSSERRGTLSARWEHPGGNGPDTALAVGNEATLRVSDPSHGPLNIIVPLDITSVRVGDDALLEVVAVDGNAITLRALSPGSTTLHVDGYGHGNPLQSDVFPIHTAEVDRTEFTPECGTELAYLTSTTYDATLSVLDAEGRRLHGSDLTPLTLTGDHGQAELLDYADIPPRPEPMFPILTTGEDFGRYVFTPSPAGEVVELDVIAPDAVDGLTPGVHPMAGAEPEALRLTPQLRYAGKRICGDADLEATYLARALTPEHCRFVERGERLAEVNAPYPQTATLEVQNPQECTIEVEVSVASGSEPAVVVRRSWEVGAL
ncbi:hypothetical protein FRC96_11510 [Lujinxingia vulgaris]|uniref:Uncharacterized protein n=1 Tax=Lujinxingia vulgaris TaxID=2600176 RepID=A0A5C6X2B8_9DELT|nr:pilus assembly protein N-terminal domain-containing protein [Lujinxingia vulgaris]TXD35295.1 hypothetical protein FRC96_11510 [Lujinxingia vulgaris]